MENFDWKSNSETFSLLSSSHNEIEKLGVQQLMLYFTIIFQINIILNKSKIMKGILIVMIALVAGCGNQTNSTSNVTQQNAAENVAQVAAQVEVLNVVDFKAKMASLEDYHLIDVRTPGEVAGGTIENATNINYSTANFATELGKLDKSKPLMLFCRSGSRSGRASQIAKDLGFTEIYDLQGGFMAWPQN